MSVIPGHLYLGFSSSVKRHNAQNIKYLITRIHLSAFNCDQNYALRMYYIENELWAIQRALWMLRIWRDLRNSGIWLQPVCHIGNGPTERGKEVPLFPVSWCTTHGFPHFILQHYITQGYHTDPFPPCLLPQVYYV